MKKLLATLALLLPVAFLFGRWRSPEQTIVVTPPDVHVHPSASETEALPTRYGRWRGGLDRNKIWLDPYIVALISAVAAGFAIVIAGNSNEINDKQTDLLERQITLQEAQALPVFVFDKEIDHDEEGVVTTERIILGNQGGIARNVSVQVYRLAGVSWDDENGERQGISVPISSYDLPMTGVPYTIDHEGVAFGTTNNVTYMRQFEEYIAGVVSERGWSRPLVLPEYDLLMFITYIDYQGNTRKEFFRIFGHEVYLNDNGISASAMDPEKLDSVLNRYSYLLRKGYSIDIIQNPEGGVIRENWTDTIQRLITEESYPVSGAAE